MRRLWAIASVVALVGALGLVAGCGGSSEEEAQTPTSATTVANSAAQTNSEGKTVTAPAETTPPAETTAPAETAAAPPAAAGDVAAGKTFFAATCTGCHMADGTEAGGVGPKLAGLGLDAAFIEKTVDEGAGGIMPPGLATGDDLTNVTAYVLSLQ